MANRYDRSPAGKSQRGVMNKMLITVGARNPVHWVWMSGMMRSVSAICRVYMLLVLEVGMGVVEEG